MELTADLHIHSHYSRATSRDLTFEHLTRWAQLKGVHLVGTGDITHPGWLLEMQEKLEPAEEGLFRLKDEYAAPVESAVYPACRGLVRFVLAGEISNIYKQDGRVRKIHNVVFAPTLEAVARLQAALSKIGNIQADGRPILGLSSRDLLEIILEVDDRCCLIPAHIWTPWFSLLGSKSGFDSVEECFGDLTPHIFALETGLSSDPPMNWRVSALDRYTLVSNSDAHSPQKLAREATLFNTELSYTAIFDALRSADPERYRGTIEFFPEEGKYHYDGHRKCGVSWDPKTTLAHQGICPVCGKPVTVGVMHRVESLADRPEGARPARARSYYSLIPLPEILAEIHGVGPNTKTVRQEYVRLLSQLGPELAILRQVPLEEIARAGGERLAEGIGRMRRGEVVAIAGYDGAYGTVKLFKGLTVQAAAQQMGLFGEEPTVEVAVKEKPAQYQAEPSVAAQLKPAKVPEAADRPESSPSPAGQLSPADSSSGHPRSRQAAGNWPAALRGLNPEQREAVTYTDRPLLIVAGPGTGKTRTLTVRIAHLIRDHNVRPEAVLAVTFTNKAAEEMAERLSQLLGAATASRITIKTFHALGVQILQQWGDRLGLPVPFAIYGEEERRALLKRCCAELSGSAIERALAEISAAKIRLQGPELLATSAAEQAGLDLPTIYQRYEEALRRDSALDFDDLILQTIRLLETCPDVLQALQERYRWISVDEYQDVNLAQYRLLQLLTADGVNLCAIGDPDQAIYGFRGADYRFFLRFSQDYPGAKVVHLRQNYRSTQAILEAAKQIIGRNPDRQAVEIWSGFVDQVKLDVFQAPTDRAEAEYVVHRIEQMVGGTSYFSLDSGRVDGVEVGSRSFGDFAVLYRLRAQSRLLIEAFERSGIPYQSIGQAPLATQPEVRDVLACLWLLRNPRSQLHWQVVLGSGTGGLSAAAAQQAAGRLSESVRPAEALRREARAPRLSPEQRRRLSALAALWSELESTWTSTPVSQLIEQVWKRLRGDEGGQEATATPPEAIRQLLLRATPYGQQMEEFLASLALQSETDLYDPRAHRVALMTLHAAKGLEFPVVFIVGCEEGLLPYQATDGEINVAEERRLFYVGMTRAQQKLILTHARGRVLYGQRREPEPSRFLSEIEQALKEVQQADRARKRRRREEHVQLSLF